MRSESEDREREREREKGFGAIVAARWFDDVCTSEPVRKEVEGRTKRHAQSGF